MVFLSNYPNNHHRKLMTLNRRKNVRSKCQLIQKIVVNIGNLSNINSIKMLKELSLNLISIRKRIHAKKSKYWMKVHQYIKNQSKNKNRVNKKILNQNGVEWNYMLQKKNLFVLLIKIQRFNMNEDQINSKLLILKALHQGEHYQQIQTINPKNKVF